MSLFKKIKKGIKKVAKIGVSTLASGGNPYAGAALALSSKKTRQQVASPQSQVMAQTFGVPNMSLIGSALPALGRVAGGLIRGPVGTVARRTGGAVGRNVGTIATVGGTAAILYDQFGNPVRRKRPRAKGITARELKGFTRVTGILNKYCKTPPPTKRRGASFGTKKCR